MGSRLSATSRLSLTPDVRSREMKPRMPSIMSATAYLLLGGILAHVAPRFGAIYADLLGDKMPLPLLTRIVLFMAPTGWIMFAACMTVFLLGKDMRPWSRRIPNLPFNVLLLLIGACTVAALFIPLVVDIGLISSTQEMTEQGVAGYPPQGVGSPER